MVALLVLAAVATGGAATTSPASTSQDCSQSVTHDAFRTADAVQVVNETGEATSVQRNTETTVEDVPGFVRLRARNPNGYCVAFTVEISSEIVSPADLGTVDSTDDAIAAEWRAIQNLSSGELYTRITFVLPADANATFAPSTARVKSLAWTGQAKNASSGWFTVPSWLGGEGDLEERQYQLEPDQGTDAITIPLESDDGRRIEDWQATYTYQDRTRPVTQDATDPVYYTETESAVTFHFNKETATVDFTANPTVGESVSHDVKSYGRAWEEIASWVPITYGGLVA